MFLYKITTNVELTGFIEAMATYAVLMQVRWLGGTLYLQVKHHHEVVGDFRLAEMYMQMNYHQISGVCPACALEGEAHCGHLTFGKEI